MGLIFCIASSFFLHTCTLKLLIYQNLFFPVERRFHGGGVECWVKFENPILILLPFPKSKGLVLGNSNFDKTKYMILPAIGNWDNFVNFWGRKFVMSFVTCNMSKSLGSCLSSNCDCPFRGT